MKNKKIKFKGRLARQGDVYLLKINKLPEGLKEKEIDPTYNGFVLAYGEVSGHAHTVEKKKNIKCYTDSEGRIYLQVLSKTQLDHLERNKTWTKEHFSFVIDESLYIVTGQREYTPQEIVRVRD